RPRAPHPAPAPPPWPEGGFRNKSPPGAPPGPPPPACRDLGIPLGPDGVLTADRVDALTDTELSELARRTPVFARCTPEDKARISAALRTGGHTGGFLGDRVTDPPPFPAPAVGLPPP